MEKIFHTRTWVTLLTNALPALSHGLFALILYLWWVALTNHRLAWPLILGAFIMGNLPDIDAGYSHIGRLVPPLSRFLEARFGHRTITHSLLAVGVVATVAYSLSLALRTPLLARAFTPWWWWPAFYAAHLLFDLIVGGAAGIPLLWPWRRRIWLEIDIRPGSTAERVVFLLLLLVACLPFAVHLQDLSPNRLLRSATGSVAIALQDVRDWEALYDVRLQIAGTWQSNRQPVEGVFDVTKVEGGTFHLVDTSGRAFTAGQGQEDVYLRRAVAIQGSPRRATWSPPPAPTPTPLVVTIRIANVYDPDTEILVKAGDVITRRQLLADLRTYATVSAPAALPPSQHTDPPTIGTSPPSVRPVVPTITASPPALALAAAASDLQLARAQATVAAAPPSPEEIAAACQEVERLRNALWQAQLERDALKIKANEGGVPWEQIGAKEAGLAEMERQIAVQAAMCEDLRARPHAADDNALAVAAARLTQAQVDYRLAVARLTPSPTPPPTATPTASPTPTATPTRTPPPTPQTQIRSIVAGQVVAVHIVAVTGEVATVEIAVALPSAEVAPAPTAAPASALNATVDHVVDGDTVAVRLAAPLGIFGAGAEVTVRLIGIDTPETVNPNTPIECYGREASAYTEQLLLPGQAVRLATDVDPTDKYGRLLAYVWLPDGRLVNELLALGGYAQPATIAPNVRYQDRFRAAAAEARAAGRGLWSACP